MNTPSARPRLAAAVAARARSVPAHAFGAAFALQENSGERPRQRVRRRRRVHRGRQRDVVEPGVAVEADDDGSGGRAAHRHAVDQVPRRRLGPGVQPAARRHWRRCGRHRFVPNMYIAVPINRQWVFGLGINAPFGLVTEWDGDWLGRFQAVKSEVKTINVNPAISWRPPTTSRSAWASTGSGSSRAHNKVNYSGALVAGGDGAEVDRFPRRWCRASSPRLRASSRAPRSRATTTPGAGTSASSGTSVRIRASARATARKSSTRSAATSSFDHPVPTVPPALAGAVGGLDERHQQRVLYNGGIKADITLPAIVNVSIFHRLNDRWDVMGDVQWTGWSSIPDAQLRPHRRPAVGVAVEHPRELRRRVARVGRRELPPQRPLDVPGRRRVRPVAGQYHRPHAAAARRGPLVVLVRRAIQVLEPTQVRRSASPTSSRATRR